MRKKRKDLEKAVRAWIELKGRLRPGPDTLRDMTDQLFAEDAYLTSCEATVVDIRDEGVILDRTVFYARGGGQPGDTGTSAGTAGSLASPTP